MIVTKSSAFISLVPLYLLQYLRGTTFRWTLLWICHFNLLIVYNRCHRVQFTTVDFYIELSPFSSEFETLYHDLDRVPDNPLPFETLFGMFSTLWLALLLKKDRRFSYHVFSILSSREQTFLVNPVLQIISFISWTFDRHDQWWERVHTTDQSFRRITGTINLKRGPVPPLIVSLGPAVPAGSVVQGWLALYSSLTSLLGRPSNELTKSQ